MEQQKYTVKLTKDVEEKKLHKEFMSIESGTIGLENAAHDEERGKVKEQWHALQDMFKLDLEVLHNEHNINLEEKDIKEMHDKLTALKK